MNNLKDAQLLDWIKQQSKVLYPDFFDDDSKENIIDIFVQNTLGVIGNRRYGITEAQLKNVTFYETLYLMFQLEHREGMPTAVKAGSIDVELNGNELNGNNPFAHMLGMWLQILGWNQWGYQFL